jgi:hypothetical protein
MTMGEGMASRTVWVAAAALLTAALAGCASGGNDVLSGLAIFEDPEAIFQEGWLFCDVGEYARGLSLLERGLARGYLAASTLKHQSQFDGIRGNPAFQSLLADAEAGRDRALAAFRGAGGERLLGL